MTNGQSQTFESFIESERQRLSEAREAVLSRRAEIDEELRKIEMEFRAIHAYEQAKRGRAAGAARGRGAPRGPRGEKRAAVLELIAGHPEGITRAEILEKLDAKGDKRAEQRVSNMLSSLRKRGEVMGERGIYQVAS